MVTRQFTAAEFTSTQWSTTKEKAKFANQFARFALSGCKDTLFPKWFYQRLSMCFGHIVHYDQGGFYHEWFSTRERQYDFFLHVLDYPCYGDPALTYSDVEKEIQAWVDQMGFAAEYQKRFNAEVEQRERAQLTILTAKYS